MKRFHTLRSRYAPLCCSPAPHTLRWPSTRCASPAKDTVALAKFYQAAFGMQEVNRIENPGGTEVFVNFGATVEAAKAK